MFLFSRSKFANHLLRFGSLTALALVLGTTAAGCGDNPAAGPEGSASGSNAKAKPLPQPKKVDPTITMTFRADECYLGALSLKHAREAYLASLGGAEPSADKIPEFGLEPRPAATTPETPPTATMEPAGSASPATSGAPASSVKPAAPPAGSAKPAVPPTAKPVAAPTASAKATPVASGAKPAAPPTAKPAGSAPVVASAAASAPVAVSATATAVASTDAKNPVLDPRNRPTVLPYDRFVRNCNVAASLKEPAAPDLTSALKDFADFGLKLTKDLQDANAYYFKKDYEKDGFKTGLELHKKLVEAFASLDDRANKVKAAVDAWKTANPVNTSGYEESQKLSLEVVNSATALLMAADSKNVDVAAYTAAVTKYEGAFNALKAFGEANKDKKDPWAQMVTPPGSQLLTEAKALTSAESFTEAKKVALFGLHAKLTEADYRAVGRKNSEGMVGRGSMPMPDPKNIKQKMPHPPPQQQ
ncbi:MAG: DUF3829 domain-containing protein [Polyangiaceae bacterium]